ncbi:serine/threonine-protein kinase mTOR [Cimex lectularius]|uniref:Serine/threonine-protein kinase TOR n=1 Tax=Cimex lectularius TaxID=79782 RepID=A0A8I6RYI9_CIMLE|nr:serine/threonine-protein kinase mTOR [Cimex lectularius]
MSTAAPSQFVNGLKSRSAEVRAKAAKDLYKYVKTELRELSSEELAAFMDEFTNKHIYEMVSSQDVNENKGGILAIMCLISSDTDAENINSRTARNNKYTQYLRYLLPSQDNGVMELTAKAIGKLALVSGARSEFFVKFEIEKAKEWLNGERHEGKRHAAVLILRELAVCAPTYFFQQVQSVFEPVLRTIRDPKPAIRESAVEALRAALVVTAQRETTKQMQKPHWYKQCYEEAKMGFDEVYSREKVNRDDKIHGSLLVLNELLRCSNTEWEHIFHNISAYIHSPPQQQDNLNFLPKIKLPLFSNKSRQTSPSELVVKPLSTMEPIYESAACKSLITENFDDICSLVLTQRVSRSPHIHNTLLTILPRLAAFNKDKFVKMHLQAVIVYLLTTIRSKERDRSSAFTTLGFIAVAVEKNIISHLPKIMEAIKNSLPSREATSGRKRLEPALFGCITLLGHAVDVAIKDDIKQLLPAMFASGLSPALTTALRELAKTIPQLKRQISEGLLGMLSQVVMNTELRHPGQPLSVTGSVTPAPVPHDVSSVVLALRTLGTFNFDGHSLLQFVKKCSEDLLYNEQQEIRLEAVCTCVRLLKLAIESTSAKPSPTVTQTVSDVLSKLLDVAITDVDADVRYWVLASLDNTFDLHLGQAESLSKLFVAMNDEVFDIRELAVCTIGRLTSVNPAYTMPSLRKALIQLITELEHSGMSRNKEQSARMLDHLVLNAPRLIQHYIQPILRVLVPKLKEPEPNPIVIINILKVIGDLAEVNGNEMVRWREGLAHTLLDLVSDVSFPEKRGVALWTLGQIVGATGFVVEPYSKYPTLLDTLINFLKTEQQPEIRRETIRVLGLLGALDTFKHKMNHGQVDTQMNSTALLSMTDGKSEVESSHELTTSEMLVNMSSSTLEEYYPAIAIATLMRIIRDPALSRHHLTVVQAVTFIFQSLGIKCVPYIPQVIPSFINVIRTAESSFREFLLQQLATLIAIVKQHIRNYLDEIFKLIKEFWTVNSPLQSTLIFLVEHIAVALGAEFKVYLPLLMPQILKVLSHDSSKDRTVTVKLLKALQKFGNNLDEYMHLVLPPIVKLFNAVEYPMATAKEAIETIDHLSDTLDFTDYASRIIHPLVRSMDQTPELCSTVMDTLCSLIVQFGKKFKIFIPLVKKVMNKHRILCHNYDVLVTNISSNNATIAELDYLSIKHRMSRNKTKEISLASDHITIKRVFTSAPSLQLAWTATRRVSKDDWLEWLKGLSIEFLKFSSSPALRSCGALAETYTQLPRDLFNAAFVSCWTDLSEPLQQELIRTLEQALEVPDLPEIIQTILNLAEFMEHCDKGPLPLNAQLLGEKAMQCRAYAKALHYKEEEFHKGPTSQVVEALISINNKLQQREAAMGLLEYAMTHECEHLKVEERWYEKLHNWEKALDAYEEKLQENPHDIELALGQMRCMEALGDWDQLHSVASVHWNQIGEAGRERMSRMAAAAAWGLEQWDSVEQYVSCIPKDTTDGSFYRAVLAIHKQQYTTAQQLIDTARDMLDTELTSMAGESYQRAYPAMVSVQMLAELEEVIQYKLVPQRQPMIRSMWWRRLQGCQRIVEDWQRIIQVRTLVVSPQEDMYTWLKYASLCRKSGRLKLSHKTLVMLMGFDPTSNGDQQLPTTYPQVTYAYTKHLWTSGEKDKAFSQLNTFIQAAQQQPIMQLSGPDDFKQQDLRRRLLARCYMKLGSWQEQLQGINEQSIPAILQCYMSAKQHDDTWYKAWHAWAYMNFQTVLFYKNQQMQHLNEEQKAQHVSQFTVPAVEGFFKSIALSHGSSLQDTLRLLTLWFDYGQWPQVYEAIVEGIRTIEINTWLQVIPQLIARIDTVRTFVGRLVHRLLIDIGKQHPQALVYPLTVASKSASLPRRFAANKILKSMREHSPNLVQQAVMVSDELIRVAILWHELWHEGLEEASRLYFGEQNVKGMFETLEPLHAMLERGPQTLKETSFNQAYGADLGEAMEWCHQYKISGNVRDLNQAWDLYYHVFRRITRQLPQLTSLELHYVSPRLLLCRDLELAVPGSYVPNQPIVRIAYINSSLQVITSKQRPRKLCIKGSNGNDYMFLLKGHEDLRQDERVMQLFGLVNTLLLNDPDTARQNLTIQRYAVIPLSTNSGLIGWVPHCDTLHTLIRDYREKKKILLNIEHRIMTRMAPDYEHLTLMQKVEVFEHALEHTQGDDLARLLWLKSPSSEVWFDRRTNYTRSLAVMSMVGYILGLGDRHPSNLMLDRLSGKILHIDFGDCFEVAMNREKFPEKIPFRLTRMLVNAMEVTGIDGTYTRTCESVMTVLHRNKDSLMAVLEAFVYDPLLNWRLIENNANCSKAKRAQAGSNHSQDPLTELHDSLSTMMTNKPAIPSSVENIGDGSQPENTNKKALAIVTRVKEKLTGRDFAHEESLTVNRQVELLIHQATSNENLCQCYIGWCPFW